MNLPQDESDVAIVTAIISMARALKLQVIAEGRRKPLRTVESTV